MSVVRLYTLTVHRHMKVNAGKRKLTVFERREVEMVDFNTLYRMNVPAVGRCEVVLGEENGGSEKCLGAVLC